MTQNYFPRWKVKTEGTIAPDETLPLGQTLAMGIQHVVIMFGSTVLAPLIMGLDPNVAIFMSGVGTLLFFLIVGGRVPSYLGSSFAFIGVEMCIRDRSYTNPMPQKDSMLAKTQANDLNGMITLEIPAEENASTLVAQYKGDRENLSPEELQMFSVGVDALQLGTKWIDWARRIEVPNGLTGRLSFDKDNGSKVKRELVKTVVSPNKTGKTSEEDLVQFTESAEEAGL